MPANQNQELRIRIIDQLIIDNQTYTPTSLWKKLNDMLDEKGEKGISERQFYKDINYIKLLCFDRDKVRLAYSNQEKRYRYSDPEYSLAGIPIKKDDINSLTQAIAILKQINGIGSSTSIQAIEEVIEKLSERIGIKAAALEGAIFFDQVPNLKGIEYLNALLNHIINRQPLKMVYQKYDAEPETKYVHPYFLKEYNNRWYLFGWCEDAKAVHTYPIDRILSFEDHYIPYYSEGKPDPEGWFKDIIGISKYEGVPKQKILLQFTRNRGNYVITKPLHPSQKTIDIAENYFIVQIEVIANKELQTLVNSYGDDCKVISKI